MSDVQAAATIAVRFLIHAAGTAGQARPPNIAEPAVAHEKFDAVNMDHDRCPPGDLPYSKRLPYGACKSAIR